MTTILMDTDSVSGASTQILNAGRALSDIWSTGRAALHDHAGIPNEYIPDANRIYEHFEGTKTAAGRFTDKSADLDGRVTTIEKIGGASGASGSDISIKPFTFGGKGGSTGISTISVGGVVVATVVGVPGKPGFVVSGVDGKPAPPGITKVIDDALGKKPGGGTIAVKPSSKGTGSGSEPRHGATTGSTTKPKHGKTQPGKAKPGTAPTETGDDTDPTDTGDDTDPTVDDPTDTDPTDGSNSGDTGDDTDPTDDGTDPDDTGDDADPSFDNPNNQPDYISYTSPVA